MSRDRVSRAGLAGMTAGALIVAGMTLGELVHENFWFLVAPAMLLIVYALIGFQSRQREQAGRLGKIGYVLALAGVGVMAVLFAVVGTMESIFGADLEESQAFWVTIAEGVLVVSFIALMIGIPLYGIATIRANVLPRLAAILFLAGLPVALIMDLATGAFNDEALTPYGLYIGFPIFALGLAWMGYALWTETKTDEEIDVEEAGAPATGGE